MKVFMSSLCAGARCRPANYCYAVLVVATMAIGFSACNKNMEQKLDPANANQSTRDLGIVALPIGNVEAIGLVQDAPGLGAQRTDSLLVNAWGIDFSPREAVWIASNHKGLSVVYNPLGYHLTAPVDIPLNGVHFGSSPTGVVYNREGGFIIPGAMEPSKFLFSTEDGIIAAWGSGDTTVTVADRSAQGAVYKGIAIGAVGGTEYVYATDFHNGRVDVFDRLFRYVSMPFKDDKMPQGFAPFNIKSIEGKLYVTYAMQDADRHDDVAGAGNGYIDIFNMDGSLYKRFATQGALNSPWGMVETESQGRAEHLLVGNFGDGHVNVYTTDGNYLGQLANQSKLLVIPGLWALAFDEGAEKEYEHDGGGLLYFTAGPDKESHGLFGYLRFNAAVNPGLNNTVMSTKVTAPPVAKLPH